MNKRWVVGVAAAMACLVSSTTLAAEILRFGSHAPPQSGLARHALTPLLEKIQADSNGALEVQAFWGGSLIPGGERQYEAMIDGLQDGTMVFPSYTAALFPDMTLFNQPFLFQSTEEATTAAWTMLEEGHLRGFDDVKVIAIFTAPPNGLHFRDRIDSLDDVAGKRVQGGGPAEAKVIEQLGGTPVGLSIGQVPEAMSQGVIDAAYTSWTGVASFSLDQITEAHIDMPFGQSVYMVALNRAFYDNLSDEARAAIDMNATLETSLQLAATQAAEANDVRQRVEEMGHNIISATGDEYDAIQAQFLTFHQAWIDSTVDGQEKYDAVLRILEDMRSQ